MPWEYQKPKNFSGFCYLSTTNHFMNDFFWYTMIFTSQPTSWTILRETLPLQIMSETHHPHKKMTRKSFFALLIIHCKQKSFDATLPAEFRSTKSDHLVHLKCCCLFLGYAWSFRNLLQKTLQMISHCWEQGKETGIYSVITVHMLI